MRKVNKLAFNVITKDKEIKLRSEIENENWEVLDMVDLPYMLKRNKDIVCIDMLTFYTKNNIEKLCCYEIDLRDDLEFKISYGNKEIKFSGTNVVDVFNTHKNIKKHYKRGNVYEITYCNELMIIDCTSDRFIRITFRKGI